MLTSTLLYGGLIPAAAALQATLLAARLRTPPSAQWSTGVAAGVIVGLLALKSRAGRSLAFHSALHPAEAADWVPLIVFISWLAAMLCIAGSTISSQPTANPTVYRIKRTAINVASLLFTIAVPLRLLSGNARLTREWSAFDKLACLAILAATLATAWRLLASDDNSKQAVVKLPLLVATTLATAIVLTFHAHVLVYGEACATLAAALTGTASACFPGATGSASASRESWITGLAGAAAPITFTLGSYLILGRFFADLSTPSVTLLALSLVVAGGPMPAQVATRPLWQQIGIRVSACLLPLIFLLIRTEV